jgi:hypothetical protein
MDILRVPSYSTDAVIDVSDASTQYPYTVTDMADYSVTEGTATSNSSSKVTISLPKDYDGSYIIHIDDTEHYIDVVRPYVDPTTKGTTASEIAEYAKHEELARAIIDSVIIEGFYYKKQVLETTGLGADYIPLWINAKKVLKLHENNVLLYDASDPESYSTSYKITSDKTSIVEVYDDRINRLESAQVLLPGASSDILDVKYVYRGFPRTFDYKILLAVGYPKIPGDIVKATELLIEDIACGKLDYTERYMSSYQTDQFKIGFDKKVFEGTGNFIVDKILSNYAKSITKLGVL